MIEQAKTKDVAGVYRVVDIAALLADDSDVPALVDGIIYPGMMTLIGSWVGKGKTTLAMGMIAALIKQDAAFGALDVVPLVGHVVYFSEVARQSLRKQLRRTLTAEGLSVEDFTRHVTIIDIRGSILDPEVRRAFDAATEGAGLIVIDTFDVWCGGNPNKTADTLKAWGALKEAAQRGAAILVLDHQAKPKAGYGREHSAVAGASAKQRELDIVFRLDSPEGSDDSRVLQPVKDRHGDAVTLRLHYDNGRYAGEVTQRPEPVVATPSAPRDAAGQFIGQYLREHGASQRKDIVEAATAVGHASATIDRALRSMEGIVQDKHGVYQLGERAATSGPVIAA